MRNVNEMGFKLRRENELLFCCARTKIQEDIKDKIIYLATSEIDWEYLMEYASKNRLLPLLYNSLNQICSDKVPQDVLYKLKESFLENARKNLLLTSELIKVTKILKKNAINSFTYKGPVLADNIYGNISYRQFNDIDIFVDKSDALKAKKLLISEGYDLTHSINIDDITYMELDAEYRFESQMGALIEINWNFEGTFFSFPMEPKFIFKNLKKCSINNFTLFTPSPSNQLLMLSIHCAKHDWQKLSWICDISEFIQKENICWEEVFIKARKLGVEKILLINLFLSRVLFAADIPSKILLKLEEDASVKSVSFTLIKILLNQKSLNIFSKFFLDLIKRDKLFYGIKDIFLDLTRYTYTDIEDIKLPKKLFMFYPLIRPFLLIKRYKYDSIR